MDSPLIPLPNNQPSPTPILDRLRASYTRGLAILENKQVSKGEANMWLRVIGEKLAALYGPTAPIIKLFREKATLIQKNGIAREQFELELAGLKGLIDHMVYMSGADGMNPVSSPSAAPAGKNVFIIHGHDELNMHRLTLLLQNQFRLNPVVIIAKPGMSRPLIDKFEDSASACSFAFALVTPDDEIASDAGRYYQARPNVIFELGWFVGRLGKHRAAIILKDGTQIHSDIHGVSRIQFRDNVEEKFLEIQRELTACGMI